MQGLVQLKTKQPLLFALKEHFNTIALLLFGSLAGNPGNHRFFCASEALSNVADENYFLHAFAAIVSIFPVIKTFFDKLIL